MPASALYTSELAELLAPGVLERFLRYVRVDTQSAATATGREHAGPVRARALLVAELQTRA